MSYVICDIDGTIANLDHRLHYIKGGKPNWHAFHQMAEHDTVYDDIRHIVLKLTSDPVVFLTARPESTRQITAEWLLHHGFKIKHLFMRIDGDYTPDYVFKRKVFLEKLAYLPQKPIAVFEDRNCCVKMWRELGLPCLQVKDGNY